MQERNGAAPDRSKTRKEKARSDELKKRKRRR